MTQVDVRNTIVRLLYEYLGGPKVVLSDQMMPETECPYIYYQSVQQRIPGPYNIGQTVKDGAITKYRSEHAQASYSFTACSMKRMGADGKEISGDDEALNLADRAQGFFLLIGRQLLADAGIVVVDVQNAQSRSAMDGDETDRRYGFDVTLRYERRDAMSVPAMTGTTIYNKED